MEPVGDWVKIDKKKRSVRKQWISGTWCHGKLWRQAQQQVKKGSRQIHGQQVQMEHENFMPGYIL